MYISDNKLYFADYSNVEKVDKIPNGNWLLCFNDGVGYFLEKKQDFTLPSKLYGTIKKDCEKFLKTFSLRNKNTGILLTGLKGTGKSVLARLMCINSKMAVIIVPEAYSGSGFINFISSLNQELVFFIDEFEKVYSGGSQESLLSILDGTFPSKFLFLLTANDSSKINRNMLNRPGRIHYMRNYVGLDLNFIKEVVVDKLDNKDNIEEILQICTYIGEVSMDVLTSLLEECNMYPDESPKFLLKDLNIKPEDSYWNYEAFDKENNSLCKNTLSGHPLEDNVFEFGCYDKDEEYQEYELDIEVCEVKYDDNKIVIIDDDCYVVFTKNKKFNYII